MAFTLTYDEELKKNIWYGYPDPDYLWDGDRLKKETKYIDGNGKEQTSVSFQDPIKIIANFNPDTKISLASPEISTEARKKFGGGLKGFVWLDKISGGGEVVLPFTAPHIFKATGPKSNPTLTEINTNSAEDDYYEVIDNKTHVHVSSFSGVGGVAGTPPTLIAHYKMNDVLATTVVADETGSHNGVYTVSSGSANTIDHSVAGKINTALDFPSGIVKGHVVIPDHNNFSPGDGTTGTPFSISVWVNMHDATNFIIANKGVYNTNLEWQLEVSAIDFLYWFVADESVASCFIGQRTNVALTSYENKWFNIIVTYDGGILSSGLKIYINAVCVGITVYENNAGSFVAVENDLSHDVWIGNYNNANYANGLIDNIMFFNKELTPDEIKRLDNNGHGTEILAEVDEPRALLRRNNSPFGLRSRYEK